MRLDQLCWEMSITDSSIVNVLYCRFTLPWFKKNMTYIIEFTLIILVNYLYIFILNN